MNGRILVGDHNGVYIIRFEGDVRLTLCGSFDRYLEGMLADPNFVSMLVDLSAARAVDSTSLGVLAKLSIEVQRKNQRIPALVCSTPDILRILDSMGFDDVYAIVDSNYVPESPLAELPLTSDLNEDQMREQVISAHKVLMDMNAKNADTFKDLVSALEAEGALPKSQTAGHKPIKA